MFKYGQTNEWTDWWTDGQTNNGDYYGPHRVNPGSKMKKTYFHRSAFKTKRFDNWVTYDPILERRKIGLQHIWKWTKSIFGGWTPTLNNNRFLSRFYVYISKNLFLIFCIWVELSTTTSRKLFICRNSCSCCLVETTILVHIFCWNLWRYCCNAMSQGKVL